jgi:pyrophosphatase PpaX
MNDSCDFTARYTPADFDGIVFDLDGVLTDTWRLYLESYRKVFAEILNRDLTVDELVEKARTTETGTLSAALPPDLVPAGLAGFKQWYVRLFDELATPFAKAVRAVRKAREMEKHVGIFTGKTRHTARFTIDRLGVADVVESLASEDDYVEPKPHHGGLMLVLAELDLAPERTLYIGDQKNDLIAGRRAGVVTAGATWAEYTTIEAVRDKPDILFPSPASCLDFFNGS